MSAPGFEQPFKDEPEFGPYIPQIDSDELSIFGEIVSPQQQLLHSLHLVRESVADDEDNSRSNIAQLGELALIVGTTSRYIWSSYDRDVLDRDYDLIAWHPKPGTETEQGVRGVSLLYPDLSSEHQASSDVVVPNDVIVVITNTSGNKYKYLLNEYGLTGYDHADDLEFDESEILTSDISKGEMPNVYKVTRVSTIAPLLVPEDLKAMLLRDSKIDRSPKPDAA